MKYSPIIASFPHFLHGGDYNPEQWLQHPEIIDEDFRLMEHAGCNTFSLGVFAWTHYESEEGKFNFDWLDMIMDRLAGKGYNAILATPSGARPAWMAAKYPEVRRVDRNGVRQPYNGRHNHCWTSPVYREKVAIINTKLAERYKDHPALGAWHISNEYSGECFCDLCLHSWYDWLKNKYKTLDNLNECWWTYFWSHSYTAWDQVDPRDYCLDGLRLDWSRFVSWQCCDFMRHESVPLRNMTPRIPITTNMMGFYDLIDYWAVAEVCDFISDDAYPSWHNATDNTDTAVLLSARHDMHRSMKAGKPFLLIESCPSATNWEAFHRLKRPGVHKSEMLLALAHGADGAMYFQYRKGKGAYEKFHGAVIDHVGHEKTRVFKEVAEVGDILGKLDTVVGTSVRPEVAVLYDWEVKHALEFSIGPSDKRKNYLDTFTKVFKPFWRSGVSVDVIQSACPFDSYRMLVLPMFFMIKEGVAERIEQFVAAGGTVIATYLTGIVDDYGRCLTGGWPGRGLRKVFGIWNEEIDGITPDDIQQVVAVEGNALGLQGTFKAVDYCERIHLEGAEALAVYGKDFYAGEPAVTVNNYGNGRAYYIAARTDDEFLMAFTSAVITASAITKILPVTLPDGVTAQRRMDGEKEFIFIFNFINKQQTVDLGDETFSDMLSGEEAKDSITLAANGSTVLEKTGKHHEQ